jgi:endonuclease/exonuclease/phosphatase family metal-dependent hydrolase
LPFQSPAFVRGEQWNYGDGLSYFSRLKVSELRREAWRACHGMIDSYFDCLTPKGFTSARVQLADGVEIDVYNLHLDAGGGELDLKARVAQVEQLSTAIRERSEGRALLVAGDTNIRGQQRALLTELGEALGLVDVCTALRCPDARRIDRVFYRSSTALSWTPRKWSLDKRFVDDRQRPLSDHLAVAVELDWRVAVVND